MTDTTAARAYLGQYQQALRELDYYAGRIETLEARLLRGSTPTDAHAGWTGEYEGRAKDGRGRIITRDPSELIKAWRVMATPKSSQGSQDPKSGERLIHALVQRVMEYEERAIAAEGLCHEIEASIDRHTVGVYAMALKHRYIENLTYEQVGQQMGYSNRHIRRILDEAMEEFAHGMAGSS